MNLLNFLVGGGNNLETEYGTIHFNMENMTLWGFDDTNQFIIIGKETS